MNAWSLPTSHQGLDAVVDEARRRQDALVEQVGALARDSRGLQRRLQDLTQSPPSPSSSSSSSSSSSPNGSGFWSTLSRRLKRRRATGSATAPREHFGEQALQQRVDDAIQETKRASWLADRFAALRHDLDLELATLAAHAQAAELALQGLQSRIVAARLTLDDDGLASHQSDAMLRERATAERHQALLEQLVERLGVLAVAARGVIDIVDTLHTDVAAFAASASRHTDALSARARAIGVAEDAHAVLRELEGALTRLGGTLDEADAFASAVHERMSQSSSTDPGFALSLETLVQAALARRAAVDARERAGRG